MQYNDKTKTYEQGHKTKTNNVFPTYVNIKDNHKKRQELSPLVPQSMGGSRSGENRILADHVRRLSMAS